MVVVLMLGQECSVELQLATAELYYFVTGYILFMCDCGVMVAALTQVSIENYG